MIRTYDSHYRGECRSERCEQIDAMGWLQKNYPERWPLIWHTPGETRASPQHMQMRAKEGVKPGIPDVVDAACSLVGFFELKRLDKRKSKVSADQLKVLDAADKAGHFAAVCYGISEFKKAYSDFIISCSRQ